MTREECKTILNHTGVRYDHESECMIYENVGVDLLMNRIFDDFESRTCESCVNISATVDEYENYYCMSNVSEDDDMSFVNLTFGCNKWEAKNVE